MQVYLKTLSITIINLLVSFLLSAQVPNAINFQAIARDSYGNILAETPIMIQLTILNNNIDGDQIYREIRSVTTNAYGSFSFQIGRNPFMSVGDFSNISWSAGAKFLRIDYDPTASLNFELSLGTIEFVTVPYAFAAREVIYIDANGASDGDILIYDEEVGKFKPGQVTIDTVTWDNVQNKPIFAPVATSGNYNDLTNIPTNVSNFNNDAGYITENQYFTVSTIGDTLYLSNGSYVIIPGISNTNITNGNYCPDLPTFTDSRDGKVYSTVKIGNQCWMGKNLAYLPNVVGPATSSSTNAYYYVYGYNGTSVSAAKATSNYATYGVLYNWPAAMAGCQSSTANPSGVQGVCPDGWHLPSDSEFNVLVAYLGNAILAGRKLKESGLLHWLSPNPATNETGFSALPAGFRTSSLSDFVNIGYTGKYWSATEYDSAESWSRTLSYYDTQIGQDYDEKSSSFSVRCLKD